MSAGATTFDVAELLTDVARGCVAPARERGFALLFDYEGPLATARGRSHAVRALTEHALRHAVQRGAQAYVLMGAQVHCEGAGAARHCHAAIHVVSNAAAAGVAPLPAELALFPGVAWEDLAQGGRSPIRGRSDAAQARISIASLPGEGEVIRIDAQWPLVDEGRADGDADAHGARAWLVARPPAAASMLARRLQRLGWATSTFATLPDVQRAWHHNPGTPPSLLIGLEAAGVEPASFARIAAELAVRAVFGRALAPSIAPGIECWPQPFGPLQLLQLTEHAGRSEALAPTGLTEPAPLTREARQVVLVVDDNAVNRLLAKEMLQTI